MKIGVVVVAGGRGERMGADVPKQFLALSDDRCVLEATVERFAEALPDARIAVVLPGDGVDKWRRINEEHSFDVPHVVALGGATRFESVRRGLGALPDADVIAVTDGVRPFVSHGLIRLLTEEAAEYGSAVASTPVYDTLRRRNGEASEKADRNEFFTVQTPQVFRGDTQSLRGGWRRRRFHRRCLRSRGFRHTGQIRYGRKEQYENHLARGYGRGKGRVRMGAGR